MTDGKIKHAAIKRTMGGRIDHTTTNHKSQWKKKELREHTRGEEFSLFVCDAPKGKKLGVNKSGIIKQSELRFRYILIPIVQKGKKFVTFAICVRTLW